MIVPRKRIVLIKQNGARCNPREAFHTDDIMVDMEANGFDPSKPLEVLDMGDGTYGLIDGERRLRCAEKLKIDEVPLSVVGNVSDYPGNALFNMVVMHCLSSGNQRPLTPVEVGKGAISLLKEGIPLPQIARKAGYSIALLEAAILLVNAPSVIQSKVVSGQMSLSAWSKLKHLGADDLKAIGSRDGRVTTKTAERVAKGNPESSLSIPADDLFDELATMRQRLRQIVAIEIGPREMYLLGEIAQIAGGSHESL